jgi:REP element-mobilizing transposase RayT
MMRDPFQYYRRSLRLQNLSYTKGNVYFITLCTRNRECWLGDIVDYEMQLSPYGKIAREEWLHLEIARPNVLLDEFTIMPNHIHGIIVLTGGVVSSKRKDARLETLMASDVAPAADSIEAVIAQFKANTTHRMDALGDAGSAMIWQDQHYQHRITNGRVLELLRQHIALNLAMWDHDHNNPLVIARRAQLKK